MAFHVSHKGISMKNIWGEEIVFTEEELEEMANAFRKSIEEEREWEENMRPLMREEEE